MIDEKCRKLEDVDLVKLSLKDSRYFYCLLRRYEQKLYRYVYRLTSITDDEVADIIQESFILAYQHLNDFDTSLKFSTWLYRIVHNQTINYIRKHKISFKVKIDETNEELVDWLVADTNIEKEVIDQLSSENIKRLIEKMKPEYRQVLVLKFFEEKDYQEISDILKKPMGTVASLISRAKIQFKKIYETENKH